MTDDSIRIEYNRDLQALKEWLAGVERAADFFVSGAGGLAFPVPPGQTAKLIAQASRAPYGRGEKTILDKSVRKVWQLPESPKDWRQDRRQHLRQQIEQHGLDLTHVADRKGSPQTLVRTKDRRSYERRCEPYRKDIAAMRQIAGQPPAASGKPLSPPARLNAVAGRGISELVTS